MPYSERDRMGDPYPPLWYARRAVEGGFCLDGSATPLFTGGLFDAVGPVKRKASSRYGPRRNGQVVQ
jgi:hypothetical protein